MKKGQGHKRIRPDRDIVENYEAALYGRFEGSKALEAYRTYFAMKMAAEMHRTSGLGSEFIREATRSTELRGLQDFAAAIENKDGDFLREMADFLDALKDPDYKPASPLWIAFAGYIIRQQKRIQYGERSDEITREEVKDHLSQKFAEGFDDNTFDRMEKAFGIKLMNTKPGPKPEKRFKQ